MSEPRSKSSRLRELGLVFLRLGATSFGGPAAHIGMMDHELVSRRQWLTREEFLDLIGAAALIPGPNSTEVAIHVGYRRAGWRGLLIAGTCFIVPACLITWALAWTYVRYGSLPEGRSIFYGVRPVIIAVVLQALVGLARSALHRRDLIALAMAGTAASFLGLNELVLLAGSGALAMLVRSSPGWGAGTHGRNGAAPLLLALPAAAAPGFGLGALFLFFLKVGAILFGSGYVLLAFLRADLVARWHWLTESQLMDAIAAGQITPGPVFSTATFVGYLLGRTPGAVLATIGIFLPAFVFVALSGPWVARVRGSRSAGAFLDGVNLASLSLMAVVTWQLGRGAIHDVLTALLFAASGFALFRFRINPVWLMLAGALLGLLAVPFHLAR